MEPLLAFSRYMPNCTRIDDITLEALRPLGKKGILCILGPLKLFLFTCGDRLCARIKYKEVE